MTLRRAGMLVIGAALVVSACELSPSRAPDPEPQAEPVAAPAAAAPTVQRTKMPPRARTQPVAAPAPPVESRCPEGQRTALRVMRAGKVVVAGDARELIGSRGHAFADGPLQGRNGWSLRDLAGGARGVEIVPCEGDTIALAAADHYVLTPNQRGMVKLIDLDAGGERLAKNLAEIRLLDAAPAAADR